ncbi:MAG: tRNA dihydrouridine synthase DusB [Chitinispirillaceae bacterium]|jgi:tRNA-dihydrouridine synthase B
MNFQGTSLYLSPLAGISETIFRSLAKKFGADTVVSEMVSAEGLLRGGKQTLRLCAFDESERPIGIQLFGADPTRLAAAASMVESMFMPDFINLNAGCPVPKVVSRNGGAALLKDPKLFEAIVSAMAAATAIPLTVKIRSAWNTGEWIDEEYARIAEGSGARAIMVHARSKSMRYSGEAILERIHLVKNATSIPVIGNGDIRTADDALCMLRETGCDGLMIGRGAVGNPWLFGQIKAALKGDPVQLPSSAERGRELLVHIARFREMYGEHFATKEMRKHTAWFLKGSPHAAIFRDRIFRAKGTGELKEIAEEAFGIS